MSAQKGKLKMAKTVVDELIRAERHDLTLPPALRNILRSCGYSVKDSVLDALEQELENSSDISHELRKYIEEEILKLKNS